MANFIKTKGSFFFLQNMLDSENEMYCLTEIILRTPNKSKLTMNIIKTYYHAFYLFEPDAKSYRV